MQRGYPAFKLHTWQPPMAGAPDPRRDVAACAAVREAVGPDVPLMLDPYHYYNREQALYLGRELEKLGFYWMEEPMDEHSISSYVWLTNQLDLPIVGPETAEGKMYTRAEWIVRGASDISRAGVSDLGGITPLIKTVHLCESSWRPPGGARRRAGQPARAVRHGHPRRVLRARAAAPPPRLRGSRRPGSGRSPTPWMTRALCMSRRRPAWAWM